MNSKVRGQTYKTVNNCFRIDIRNNFFRNRVVDARNVLSQSMVDVNSFKAFDKFCASKKC